ncbi:hypothetical protein TNIN_123271 [Trichonephila inaurata madagascariensis]|uniref:Uncharacterized protein n=1 Tax=Trichonephila inaurata madagascariensis TaxID=2747483 RepID=A0A8X6JEB6_9ARAC|nr:hypothetical protein TNIN_123271 [Trichonephila inaurata madagascariensis]
MELQFVFLTSPSFHCDSSRSCSANGLVAHCTAKQEKLKKEEKKAKMEHSSYYSIPISPGGVGQRPRKIRGGRMGKKGTERDLFCFVEVMWEEEEEKMLSNPFIIGDKCQKDDRDGPTCEKPINV